MPTTYGISTWKGLEVSGGERSQEAQGQRNNNEVFTLNESIKVLLKKRVPIENCCHKLMISNRGVRWGR